MVITGVKGQIGEERLDTFTSRPSMAGGMLVGLRSQGARHQGHQGSEEDQL